MSCARVCHVHVCRGLGKGPAFASRCVLAVLVDGAHDEVHQQPSHERRQPARAVRTHAHALPERCQRKQRHDLCSAVHVFHPAARQRQASLHTRPQRRSATQKAPTPASTAAQRSLARWLALAAWAGRAVLCCAHGAESQAQRQVHLEQHVLRPLDLDLGGEGTAHHAGQRQQAPHPDCQHCTARGSRGGREGEGGREGAHACMHGCVSSTATTTGG
eukprot:COSAG01_NODE_693_length_14202_cov_11.739491_13_plen_217_part_00